MEPVPLIPTVNSVSCPDTSHILREEFQEYLEDPKFSQKIAENLHEFNSKDLQLKLCGTEVINNYNQMKIHFEEMTHAEEALMISQAQFFNQNIEHNKYRLEKLFPDIDQNVIKKYSLIKVEDVMPHITERILNNKMEPEEFIFKDACPDITQSVDSLQIVECPSCELNEIQLYNLRTNYSKQNKLAKAAQCYEHNQVLKRNKYDFKRKKIFDVQPDKIEFINYEKNFNYEKQFRIRNITSIIQTLPTPVLPPNSKFSVRQTGNQNKLAPGMSATFVVSFKTSEMSDKFEDCLMFHVQDSENICVTLSSWRDTPVVKGIIYLQEEGFSNKVLNEKNDIFNHTIDCGALLYGCNKEFKFVVENCGGPGNFFILSEEDWVSGEITNITEDFRLVLEEFIVYPAYFELKEAEVKEINIVFNPTQYGLCLDKLFLLCDSNNVEEVDIIGDCIFYEPYYLKFEMPDCPLPPLKKAREPTNILHLGAIYSEQTVTGFFKVHNTSTVSFGYEWHKNKYTKKRDFTPIEHNDIEIYPNKGVFNPVSDQEFEVTVYMSNNKFGLYKFAFSLYILDILEENLREGPIYTFGQEYRNELFERCLTILVNNVEVQIHHISVLLHIYPEKMSFSSLIYQVKSETKKVRIVNEGFCCISCKWIHDKGCGCVMNSQNQVNIEPNEFDLEADTFTDCEITVTPSSYADIYETFVLSVNNGFFAKTLSITGKVTEPHIKVSRSFFDFGAMVKRGSFANAIFHVENNCYAQLLWRVQEYKYNLEMGYFVEVYPKSISADCGCLCHNGSGTELEYVLDTSRPRRFVSLLVFYTIFNSRAYESSHVILVANILQPLVCIVNENNNKNIFDINEEFFVHETITRNFFIHNDSPLEVNYKWGEVEGSHASFISISFTTWDGKLYSWSRCCVQITITFHQPVYLQDVYIPCIIEALPEPVCFNICCFVKPPQIIISLPARKNGGYEDILWPSYETLRYNEHSITGEDIVEKNVVEEFVPIQIINVLPESDKSQWYPDDIITYLENIELEMCGERFVEIQRPSTVTTAKSSETSSQISFRSYLASVFTSSTNLYTYYIYFENITCRQLHKKMFEVTNIMDLSLKFAISIKNFKIRSLHRKRLDKILINMNLLFDDTYSQQLSEYGVFVIINPELGELKNKTTLSIEIQVYAETFGLYLEEIAIEVDNLPVFYLNLFIQVSGLPIEFPAEENSQNVQDISLRYGSFSVCSKPEKRCVLIRNNCTIPYKIVWHVFIKNIEDYLKGPLNVIYDIFGFEQSPIEFKLRFLNYIGKESDIHYKLFEIAPQELYIKPKEEKSVQITLNPQYFGDMNNNLNCNIEAILIGHIYLEKQYQIIKNEASFVIRNTEKQLNPIKVNISAQIKSAHLDIKSLSGSRAIEVAVSEYLKLQKNVTINMRLLYHNSANFNISIGVNTVKPFDIISIQSANSESTIPDANNMLTCVISPKNCAEIWVKCKVDNEMLLQIADVLYKNIPHFLEDTAISKDNRVKITKPLNIYHNCDAKQEIPLSVILVFPLTFVPIEFLDFGQVTVDTEKLLTVKIQNKTESKTWFQISFEHGNVFTVCPERGYLLPNKPAEHFTYLVVIFKPNDVGDFEDNLKIVTCLTHYEQEIKLCGIGTFNEKHIHKLKLKM